MVRGLMRDMGDASADEWDAEVRRTGRVVFPLRRRWVLQLLPLQLLPPVLVLLVPLLAGAPAPEAVVAFPVLLVYAAVIATLSYQLVARRPAVVVGRDGIRSGRKGFLAWSAVGGFGIVTGIPLERSFLVL
ncbi:hypothetical protein, partial [Kribbella sp.]|uniref:hypothetical protein n=1 Tax=Kribbella sp. TaxID=1871183 RepID=UPI002D2786BE